MIGHLLLFHSSSPSFIFTADLTKPITCRSSTRLETDLLEKVRSVGESYELNKYKTLNKTIELDARLANERLLATKLRLSQMNAMNEKLTKELRTAQAQFREQEKRLLLTETMLRQLTASGTGATGGPAGGVAGGSGAARAWQGGGPTGAAASSKQQQSTGANLVRRAKHMAAGGGRRSKLKQQQALNSARKLNGLRRAGSIIERSKESREQQTEPAAVDGGNCNRQPLDHLKQPHQQQVALERSRSETTGEVDVNKSGCAIGQQQQRTKRRGIIRELRHRLNLAVGARPAAASAVASLQQQHARPGE